MNCEVYRSTQIQDLFCIFVFSEIEVSYFFGAKCWGHIGDGVYVVETYVLELLLTFIVLPFVLFPPLPSMPPPPEPPVYLSKYLFYEKSRQQKSYYGTNNNLYHYLQPETHCLFLAMSSFRDCMILQSKAEDDIPTSDRE